MSNSHGDLLVSIKGLCNLNSLTSSEKNNVCIVPILLLKAELVSLFYFCVLIGHDGGQICHYLCVNLWLNNSTKTFCKGITLFSG